MELTISSVDYAPEDLYDQTPFSVKVLRELPGEDRPDYWLCELRKPLNWSKDGQNRKATHIVLAARWQGTKIQSGIHDLPVGIAFVTDASLLNDSRFTMSKAAYASVGIAHDTTHGPVTESDEILSGVIAPAFGKGAPQSRS